MRAVGAHVPSERPIDEAVERGADLVQIFLSDPAGLAEAAAQGGRCRTAGVADPDLCPFPLPDQCLRRQQQDPGPLAADPPGDM